MTAPRPPASLEEVLAFVRSHGEDARAAGVEVTGVGGSVARGDPRPDSDVDLAVRQVADTTYFTLARWEARLAQALGRRVDLVFTDVMPAERRAWFERDLVVV